MKRKEWLAMLLPCVFLIGAGFYFSRPRMKQAPLSIAITRAEFLPLSTMDRKAGFDARLLVRLQLQNVPPERWRLPMSTESLYQPAFEWQIIASGPRGRRVVLEEIPRSSNRFQGLLLRHRLSLLDDGEQHVTQWMMSLKLRTLARSGERLELRLVPRGQKYERRYNESAFSLKQETPPAPRTLSIPSAQSWKQPLRDQRPTFTLSDVEVSWNKLVGGDTPEMQIHGTLQKPAPADGISPTIVLWHSRFETEAGVLPSGVFSGSSVTGDDRTGITIFVNDPGASLRIPPQRQRVLFKADVCVDNSWPQPIEIVLRENGKNLAPPMLRTARDK